jgi:hypothetical protein
MGWGRTGQNRMISIELHRKGWDRIGQYWKVERIVSKVGYKHRIDIGQGLIGEDRFDR